MLGSLFNGVSADNSIFMIWFIYPVMPLIGSLLSLIFFEFVYKKTQEALNHDEKSEHDTHDTVEDD
jgi:phosphate/sulfate permease